MRLELVNITKSFGPLVANDAVNLDVKDGEIHALLGENGAGKSTLMNVLFGLLHPDSGEIRIDGKPVRISNPGQAVALGIGMVHQHFMLVGVFTVAENIELGFEPTRFRVGLLDHKKADDDIRKLSAEYGLEVDPDAVVEDLPVGVQQRVEILKALARDAKLLILDEPTSVLTPQEIESLFSTMHALQEAGHSILFITHKLKEVLAVADRITVMRAGRVVGSTTPQEANEEKLASMMVGRAVELVVEKGPARPGATVLEVRGLTVEDDRGLTMVDHVDLDVHAGEIVAVAGVQGNGQTEFAEAIAGLRDVAGGTITLEGQDVTSASPRDRIRAGLADVPEDRQRDGLVLPMSVADNLVLDIYDVPPHAHRGSRDLAEVRSSAVQRSEDFDIRTSSVEVGVGTLSGGNQQKVILAREMSRPVKLLMASQPTRGLDVGSIEYVHRRLVAARDSGVAVLIVSSELDEVLALGDRIAVMFRGRIMAIVDPSVGREQMGLLMAGVGDTAPAPASSAAAAGGSGQP
jgi:simple sugar transport system ATP-binding protein